MDHAGDMLWYIHHALRQTWNYPGIQTWGDHDAYTEPHPEGLWEITDRSTSRAIMFAKDTMFEITIRTLEHGEPLPDWANDLDTIRPD